MKATPEQLAALTALNKMLAGRYFDICTIDSVCHLLGVPGSGGEAYNLLRTLHCVDYLAMPQELRDAIPGLIEQVLGVAPAYQFKVQDVNPEPAKPQGFLKMIGLKS